MADRLQRLHALAQQRAAASAPSLAENSSNTPTRRKRIVARVLYAHKNGDGSTEDDLRNEMKTMALKKREEQEKAESEMQKRLQEAQAAIKPLQENSPSQISANVLESEEITEDESEGEEEEEPQRLLLKPVFIPKEIRQTIDESSMLDAEDEDERKAEERQREAHLLLAEYVKMEGIAAAKKKDEEMEATSGVFDPLSVDDTDDLDEVEEYQAWKLRELLRIKRDRDEREAREREQIELERLRNLTEAEKQATDAQRQAEWEAKPKTEYKFLQKYYHKGAFFGDLDDAVVNRDFAQPTGTDRSNMELLPEAMQVKNFGKRGRTKWTHLTAEDTTEFQAGWGDKSNPSNFRTVNQMGGMRGDLSKPSNKRPKT